MTSTRLPDGSGPPPQSRERAAETRAQQLISFARQTPVNAFATVSVSLATMVLLWPAAPHGWLALWVVAHFAVSLFALVRWARFRRRAPPSYVGARTLYRAIATSAASGALWGASAAFLAVLPTVQQMVLFLVIGCMSAGAATTLAAIPAAAIAYIGLAILPVVMYFVVQNDPVYFGLAVLALIMTLSMMMSSRIVYRFFSEELRARREHAALMAQFRVDREEWLSIAETAEAFALFDAADRLLLWNENYRSLLSLPAGFLHRGMSRREILRRAAHPLEEGEAHTAGEPMSTESWLARQLDPAAETAQPRIERLANGRWLLSTARRTAAGHAVFAHVDITELKRTQAALEYSREHFRSIVDNLPSALALKDADGRYRLVNRCLQDWLGRSAAQLVGSTDFDIFPPELAGAMARRDARVLADGELHTEQVDLPFADGRVHRVQLARFRLPQAVGDNAPLCVIGSDMTPYLLAEQRMQQAQKMEAVGLLAGGVAHNLNNLLSVIKGAAGLALEQSDSGAFVRSELEEINRAADRAATVANQLVTFANGSVLHQQVLQLNRVVEDLAGMLGNTLGHGIELSLRLDPALGTIRGDVSQLEQILVNLAVNARDAMAGTGRLVIETANVDVQPGADEGPDAVGPGRYTLLSVTDDGCGMDEETQARIFEPFFTTKASGEGTGLGLSTVYGIVQQSGGRVAVTSAPGAGASFRLYLPQVDAAAQNLGDPAPASDERVAGTETVLLVEDDADLRELAAHVLQRDGYRVLQSSRPAEAIRLCRDHHGAIELLLTDVLMPEMNGVELARRVAQLRPHIKVLCMSGYTRQIVDADAALPRDGHFLAKPFSPGDLRRKVRSVLDSGD